MQLFKLPPPPEDLTITPEAKALDVRDSLLATSASIVAVRTSDDNQECATVGSEMQKLVKGVEATRKELVAPYFAAQKTINASAAVFCDPITTELTRLGMLAAAYRTEQERKAEAERRARAEEISRLQEHLRQAAEDARKAAEKGDLMGGITAEIAADALSAATTAAIAKPEPEAVKTPGQSFRARELGWECTDVHALYLARPELCEPLKPKASAIKAICSPESPVPGLRLWWKSEVHFNSR